MPVDEPTSTRRCARSGAIVNSSGVDRGQCARCFASGEVGDCPQCSSSTPSGVSITANGEARFEVDGRVVWTSEDHIYVCTVGEDAQHDFAPNVARGLRWLACTLLGRPT